MNKDVLPATAEGWAPCWGPMWGPPGAFVPPPKRCGPHQVPFVASDEDATLRLGSYARRPARQLTCQPTGLTALVDRAEVLVEAHQGEPAWAVVQ